VLLGVDGIGAPVAPSVVALPPGSTLVLFTDGLVETTRDHAAGFARLRAALENDAVVCDARPAASLVTTVIGDDEQHDDIAVLVATFT
jgi:serine phosphatase RsbU (regulator of sigma subunit)